VVADLVAVRLYLTEYGQRIDDSIRTAQPGSHVAFARCIAAGLRRLPSHRGAVRLRATLTDAEWRWYGSRPVVTEWAFCPALADGAVRLPGTRGLPDLVGDPGAARACSRPRSRPGGVLAWHELQGAPGARRGAA